MSLLVRQIGAGATMQGEATFGLRKYGVPQGGAFDRESRLLLNALLGRQTAAHVLELVVLGATFDVLEDCRVAVVGARTTIATLHGTQRSNSAFSLHSGDTLTLGAAASGARIYVGCDASELAISNGQAIKAGQVLGDPEAFTRAQERHFALKQEPRPPHSAKPLADPPASLFRGPLRILAGPQADMFDMKILAGEMFVVTPQCDRQGLRVEGPSVGGSRELPSEPACVGAIQVTPNGQLLILGPDGPTIGGYPKAAVVIDADLDRLAQVVPGQKLWFELIDESQARELNDEYRDTVEQLSRQLRAM